MEPLRVTLDEVKRRLDAGESVTFLDTRADGARRQATLQIPGSYHVPPENLDDHLDEIPRETLAVTYCT